MGATKESASITAWLKAMARLFRCWPFLSGCGALASSRIARFLVPPSDRRVWARVGGQPCLVSLDDLIGRSAFLVGDLDPKVTWVAKRSIRRGDTVLDVGANVGVLTLRFASLVGPVGQVLAFEPCPANLQLLEKTLSANGMAAVSLFRFALGASEGSLPLTVAAGNSGYASLKAEVGEKRFQVPVRRLSTVLRENETRQVDFMKLDVEGFEAEVLAGLFDDSCAPRPMIIVFEEHTPRDAETIQRLKAENYSVFGISKGAMLKVALVGEHDEKFSESRDFVAVSRTAREELVMRLGLKGRLG